MKLLSSIISIIFLFFIHETAYAQNRPQRDRLELYNSVEDASELKPGEDADEKIRRNFFLRAEVSKTDCYVGEPVMATFKAYSRLDANSQVIKRPSLGGFSVIEMVDAYNHQPEVESLNGEFYYVHLIRKVQLFPLQAGDFTLEPAEVESVIQLRRSDEDGRGLKNLRNLFRRNRNDPTLQKQVIFKTPEVNIHVNSLPEKDQTENFSGAVGNFTIELNIDDSVATQHEPSKITMLIRGWGNFPLITDPEIQWPRNMEVPVAVVNDDVNKYEFPLSGIKAFEYTIYNRDTGAFTIPAVSFTYFDPSSKTYKTATSAPLNYSVEYSEQKKKFLPEISFAKGTAIPMHYYYFGVVVLVVIVVIIYIAVKRPKGK